MLLANEMSITCYLHTRHTSSQTRAESSSVWFFFFVPLEIFFVHHLSRSLFRIRIYLYVTLYHRIYGSFYLHWKAMYGQCVDGLNGFLLCAVNIAHISICTGWPFVGFIHIDSKAFDSNLIKFIPIAIDAHMFLFLFCYFWYHRVQQVVAATIVKRT